MDSLEKQATGIQSFNDIYPTPVLSPPVIGDPSLPLISIVTPSYNQGAYIRETIKSVLSQDYPNIEYWVIDGGSTDDTLPVLREYVSDARFNWISEPDNGQSDAINKGLARCQGEIFIWLNSDDVFLPDALSTVAMKWIEAGRPVIIYGFARHINEHGEDLGRCPYQSSNMTFSRLLKCRSTLMQPATFVPTKIVRELGGVDTKLQYTMDFDLWVKLAEHLPIMHIPQDLALYRLHTTSKTVAYPTEFVSDFNQVLGRAVQKGYLSEKQARVRANLFAAKVCLASRNKSQLPRALKYLREALYADYLCFPEVTLVLFKALLRAALGETCWSKIRYLRSRVSL